MRFTTPHPYLYKYRQSFSIWLLSFGTQPLFIVDHNFAVPGIVIHSTKVPLVGYLHPLVCLLYSTLNILSLHIMPELPVIYTMLLHICCIWVPIGPWGPCEYAGWSTHCCLVHQLERCLYWPCLIGLMRITWFLVNHKCIDLPSSLCIRHNISYLAIHYLQHFNTN